MAKYKGIFIATMISLIPTLFLWLPLYLRLDEFWTIPLPLDGMATVVANYDGPLYIAVAKSFYNPDILRSFNFDLPTEYFAAHFPLYPLFIKIFSFIGYPYSMLFVTLISSVFAIYIFSKFISDYVDKKDVLWMTVLFSVFPARWLIVRSIGSPEPLFLAFVIASIYFFKKEKYLLAGIFGGLASFTKSPGILLFPALFCAYIFPNIMNAINVGKKNFDKKINIKGLLPLFIIPLSTLGVFMIYKLRLNDFFAYFHSGDNIHLFFPPFQIFNYEQPWVGTYWLEEVIFVYLLGGYGVVKLIKKDPASAWFAGIFFITTLFISHRDIIRYSLPILPFVLAGYSGVLVKKEFKYIFILIIIPIFLYSLAFISKNSMPISDWGPLL